MNPLSAGKMEDYELIRRYFDFELTEEELAKVNERMENDAAFVERMRLFQASDEHILQLAPSVASGPIAKTVTLKPKKNRPSVKTWRAVAAATVLLIGCSFVIWLFSHRNLSPSELAQNYWKQTEAITFTDLRSTGETDSLQEQLVAASNQFRSQNLEASLAILNAIPSTTNDDHKVALLKGEIYFEQTNFEDATEQFQLVIDHPNNELNDYAYWYQALAYLQLEQVDAAKQNLAFMLEQRYSIPYVEELYEELIK